MTIASKTIAATLAIVALPALAACTQANNSTPPTSSETEMHAPIETPPGLPTWTPADGPSRWSCFEPTTGVEYSIPVPADLVDPRIVAVEEFRKKAGVEPIEYLLVEIDATTATAPGKHGVRGAEWATKDQQNANAERTLSVATNWPGWSNNPGADVPKVEVDANTGAKGWAILTPEKPVDSMVAPMVTSGASQVPCELYPN